jgi:predicted transcriptional regulator
MRSTVRAVIRAAVQQAPGSIRELAREAGLSESALRQVRDGEIDLTADSVRRIIRALRRWSRTTADLADRLEAALEREGGREV